MHAPNALSDCRKSAKSAAIIDRNETSGCRPVTAAAVEVQVSKNLNERLEALQALNIR